MHFDRSCCRADCSFIGISSNSAQLVTILNAISVFGLLFLCGRFFWKDKTPVYGLLFWRVGCLQLLVILKHSAILGKTSQHMNA